MSSINDPPGWWKLATLGPTHLLDLSLLLLVCVLLRHLAEQVVVVPLLLGVGVAAADDDVHERVEPRRVSDRSVA